MKLKELLAVVDNEEIIEINDGSRPIREMGIFYGFAYDAKVMVDGECTVDALTAEGEFLSVLIDGKTGGKR